MKAIKVIAWIRYSSPVGLMFYEFNTIKQAEDTLKFYISNNVQPYRIEALKRAINYTKQYNKAMKALDFKTLEALDMDSLIVDGE